MLVMILVIIIINHDFMGGCQTQGLGEKYWFEAVLPHLRSKFVSFILRLAKQNQPI